VSQPGKSSNPAEPAKAPPGFASGATSSASASGAQGQPAGVRGPDDTVVEIDPADVERIERLVAQYLDSISSLAVGGAEYDRAIVAIGQLGERDFIATSAMSGRLLDRRFQAVRGLLAAKAPLARLLADLRKTASGLDPSTIKLGNRKTARDELEAVDRYFERFARSQPRLEELLASLTQGRLALEQDNAAIVTEQTSLATEMETLRQYAYLAARLDDVLTSRIETMSVVEGDRAEALRLDVLPVVKRRRQEILTQLAIVMQGFAALEIVELNNAEVIRAVASAISTTTSALRTAVMVAGAAASQRMALQQLEAARIAASTMADYSAALEAGISGPGGRVATLRNAWSEVYAALDRVDAQKAEVLKTISQADRELTRPKSVR
jgi:uncharacterized protein YaaN involved in tellurite resistance